MLSVDWNDITRGLGLREDVRGGKKKEEEEVGGQKAKAAVRTDCVIELLWPW